MQNTTISNFHTGINLGTNATLYSRCSSFIQLRGGNALTARNPHKLSFKEGCIHKCESNGIYVKLDGASK